MDRRDLLRLLGSALVLPLPLSPDLVKLGREVHRRARRAAARRGSRALDPAQRELVATVAEHILPATDTPGARAAGVDAFIDVMLAEWCDAPDPEAFLAGLADLDARARALHGTDFLACTAADQARLLTVLDEELTQEREAARAGAPWRGRPAAPEQRFFHRMKRLTLVGYYTSEIGANQELHYQIIPGRYDGCAPLESGGR